MNFEEQQKMLFLIPEASLLAIEVRYYNFRQSKKVKIKQTKIYAPTNAWSKLMYLEN